MTRTRSDSEITALTPSPPAPHPAHPAAVIPGQQVRGGSRPALAPIRSAVAGQAARGEHVHSESHRPRLPRRHSVRAQVLNALREKLHSGELAPGQVYSAPALAERFGVSPTPVREAMQQLAVEGAVETVPNRGFRVAEHSGSDRAELAEVRALLEIPPLLQLAATVPPERWQALRPLAEATVAHAARAERAAYAEADRAFHAALLELTGNRQLVRVATELRRRGGVGRPPAELRTAAHEHVALIDALTDGDTGAVERLLRQHLAR
ncbi:GntR family transcriptional regulator [Streptomyces sp. JJ66]|uniref:GntR family transcriptional regulator n=1 Tax=Streptomyces sp. JJ66 TaxID=2803843 RepID=UPI001C56ED1D|nr:GntR family transcriptional regulator [Streptomyces sp. JJ66]MBW1600652.1 GntR family transcriptional regulator [Streptomyces sp. JJ66]